MKRALINALVLALVLGLALAVLAPSTIKNGAKRYTEEGLLGAIGVDIVLKSPGKEQVQSSLAAEHEDIAAVVPYYAFYCKVRVGTAEQREDVILFDDFERLEDTPYRSARLIEGEISQDPTALILDYAAASRYGLAVGDPVWIAFGSGGEGVTFSVCAIVETNPLVNEKGSFAVQYAGTQKQLVESARTRELQYAGAYVRAEGESAALLEALRADYLPMAEVPRREDFAGEPEYDVALQRFMDGSYGYLVEDVAAKADLQLIRGAGAVARRGVLILSVLAAAAVLIVQVVSLLLSRGRIRRELGGGMPFMTVLRRYNSYWQPVICAPLGAAIVAAFAAVGATSLSIYFPVACSLRLLLPVLISWACACLAVYAVTVLLMMHWRPTRGEK